MQSMASLRACSRQWAIARIQSGRRFVSECSSSYLVQQQNNPCPSSFSLQPRISAAAAGRTFLTPLNIRNFSADATSTDNDEVASSYAVIHHGGAYEKSMHGYHGQTLAKAELVGDGRDSKGFDPFFEDELMEEELLAKQMEQYEDDDDDDDAEDSEDEEEEEDGEEEEEEDSLLDPDLPYNNDGSIRRNKSQKAILTAGAPAGGMFAIIELAGSQFKVTNDDVLIVNRLKPALTYSVGSVHTFKENVMLVGTTHYSLVGMPYVGGAEVDVMIEEITKDEKVIIFKKRRRKHSQRKRGFRRDVTMLRILEVRPPAEFQNENFVKRIEPDLLPPPENHSGDDDEEKDYKQIAPSSTGRRSSKA
mmetsp:Transcript_15934/g.20813  ORF Transcript_15934/g.20813 Transcript_15934/m.20813 type:complete len:362 (+) Transcript_15934:146-1231(+)